LKIPFETTAKCTATDLERKMQHFVKLNKDKHGHTD